MKKTPNLATLALLGITACLPGGCQPNKPNDTVGRVEQLSSNMRTFYNGLSSDGQSKFLELDAQHRMMAVEMTEQKCNGQNKCKGMGGCATADHSCAGKNSCKGQGSSPVTSGDQAVKAQYKNQTEQRQQLNQ